MHYAHGWSVCCLCQLPPLLIVALITKLSTPNPEVRFINLADYSSKMIVEPKFSLRKMDIGEYTGDISTLMDDNRLKGCDFAQLLSCTIGQFTYPNNPKR